MTITDGHLTMLRRAIMDDGYQGAFDREFLKQTNAVEILAEVRRLRDEDARVQTLETKLAAAESVLWMAEQFADGHAIAETGAEQRELGRVKEILRS